MKKSISDAQVQRMRNLVTKKYNAKTSIQTGYTKSDEDRKEGDVWEERGKVWTIKNGIKRNITKLSSARRKINKPICCPKCQGAMNHWLNDTMWPIHGMCFKCVTAFETDLKIKGLYAEYEKAIMKGNYESWLENIQSEYEEWLKTPEGHRFITESGQIEDWSINTKQATSEKISNYISRLSTEFTETIDNDREETTSSNS